MLRVEGEGGVPGASCCTLYQMAPGGSYWITADGNADLGKVASLDLRVKTGWVDWTKAVDTVPAVTLSGVGLTGGTLVTGRVTVSGTGVFNVQVFAIIEGGGSSFAVATGVVDCVTAEQATAFQVTAYPSAPEGATLGKAVGVTTTVPGVGTIDRPPGC